MLCGFVLFKSQRNAGLGKTHFEREGTPQYFDVTGLYKIQDFTVMALYLGIKL